LNGSSGDSPPPTPGTTGGGAFPWWRDRRLVILVAVTVVLRLVATAAWPFESCVRDECMYQFTADRMYHGLGMTSSNGWLWAPGYVALLALHQLVTGGYAGTIQITQAFVSAMAAVTIFRIVQRVYPDPDPGDVPPFDAPAFPGQKDRPALVASWLYALCPTFVFFSSSLWSETFYGLFLLLAMKHGALAREGPRKHAALAGFWVGACVLLRGVAQYLVPIFAFTILWRRFAARSAWASAGILVGCAVLTVAPYATYASLKFDSLVISDRTVGQMMWLGDNDFPPVTFDTGIGLLTDTLYDTVTGRGRKHCAGKDQPIERDSCETAAGIAWIEANPKEFARRIPVRLAQLFDPNSFLTRHLRMGRWHGLPQRAKEALCALVVLWSFVTVLAGGVGAWLKRGGSFRQNVVLTSAYHLAAVAALAGLSRYRVPLDTLWMTFAGAVLARPATTLADLRSSPWRLAGAVLTVALLLPLLLWYLPSGFPWWQEW
jgi:hypothetical protein